jgi:hypothetical protein
MALAGLRALAPGEPEIARMLLAATRDADLGVRRLAVTVLAALDQPPPAVFDRLIALASGDPDPASRHLAIVALGEIGSACPDSLPAEALELLRSNARDSGDTILRRVSSRMLDRLAAAAPR